MEVRNDSWRQKIKHHPVATVLIALLAIVIVLIVLSVFGYIFNWNWTGLSPYISPPHPKDSDFQRGKTLWDWLNLLSVLAIPVVVGLGAVWFTTKFNEQQSLTEHEIALDIQRETALQSYIDKMSELILREKLSDLAEADEVQKIVRVRTLAMLYQLNTRRANYVLSFLRELGLVASDGARTSIITFSKANLRNVDLQEDNLHKIDLSEADLTEANLYGANLSGANLSKVILIRANLKDAHLKAANLSGANLVGANLKDANLSYTNLSEVDFYQTDLSGVNLKGVTGITVEQLEKQAKSLKGATIPDGSINP